MATNHSALVGRINARNKRLELIANDCAFDKFAYQCDEDELHSRQIHQHLSLLNLEDQKQLDSLDELDQPLTFIEPPSEAFLFGDLNLCQS